ncbi:L-aspartate oxidase [Onishia taeanensis]|uniref:L-aspartate oxidase n=1 Tax=Onishia taeanensis TaxID=284577 RepID=A0A328XS80_9GAMM|nr:L-aspartate oxidase [Halomonas taeanensis]RAR61529.1 L-aspartate oxidase [Halomonas taeanensis]
MTRASHPQDVLILGGGAAGLALALELADSRPVTLLRPASDDHGASRWAQGGIAAVLSPQDNVEDHVQDTLIAGDGLCDEKAVRFTVEHGRGAIEWLLSLGVPFTLDAREDAPYPYHLTREGGHGARRIIHAADATGQALIETLLEHARRHPAITLRDDLGAISLLQDASGACRGARCLDRQGSIEDITAAETVLATGGASGLWRHTTSPLPACGEGMAMAAELGARLMNLEFQQFHPTCLYDPEGTPFLISEAVRGEGGILTTLDGHRFMPDIDSRAELAPRDIVARAIDAQMQETGASHVLLDISHLPATALQAHFPTIHAHCLGRGIDITRQPIPVVPAAHYSCGGVATDLDGRTGVEGLFAIGEVACTGLHGANRMASNSLLECLVFARAAAESLKATSPEPSEHASLSRQPELDVPADNRTEAPRQHIDRLFQRLRAIMSRRVGIVRDDAGLGHAENDIAGLITESRELCQTHAPALHLASLWHAVRLAGMTVQAAQGREESRGLHFNRDHSHQSPGKALASSVQLPAQWRN